jgi:hypothetical protein
MVVSKFPLEDKMRAAGYRYRNAENEIGIITDELPGFDIEAAEETKRFLEEKGYNVRKITVGEFRDAVEKPQGGVGSAVLLVPGASSFPVECAGHLKAYSERGGQLFTLGGPLFGRLIKSDGGKFREFEIDPGRLDASFSEGKSHLVFEGMAPAHKVYPLRGRTCFKPEPGQFVFNGNLGSSGMPLDLVCPVPRPYGQGYGQKRRTRYIPLAGCFGEGGRADGERGAAAFFMLSDTFNYPFSVGGTRPNSVGATITGSASAGIGFTRSRFLDIPGAGELLTSMLDHLLRGLFLFEAGAASFVLRPGETPVFGAKVLNTSQDYLAVRLRLSLAAAGEPPLEFESDLLASPRSVTDCRFPFRGRLRPGVRYQTSVTMFSGDRPVDVISHETMAVKSSARRRADDFIRVEGDNFILKGKPWYPVGLNYWPLYFAGVDEIENWYGWLSDKYYDQTEVERDLGFMEKAGFNFLITRLDGNIFDRSIPQLLDFLDRCERHNIRVGIGWPEAMSPLYYSKEAVDKFFAETGIQNNPTVFCYDLIWELGGVPVMDKYRHYWNEPWADWITERYGSVESAERDWGFSAGRGPDGKVLPPDNSQLGKDGPWRVMVAAYRRFMDDFLSEMWGAASRGIRGHAPRQLLTYRMGHIPHTNVSVTAAMKHVDFLSPEGYDFGVGKNGFNSSCFASRLMDFTGNGKPIVWMEFGMSVSGNRYASQCFIDRKTMLPPREKLMEQEALIAQFCRMASDSGCNGVAPWWLSGGIRGRDLTDFGLLSPDGLPRPAMDAMIKALPELTRPRGRPRPDMWFEFDRDAHAAGVSFVCFGAGRDAYEAASAAGKALGVRTKGTGTDSASVPLTAVGNTPFNGSNPLKYLNAEFNELVLSDRAGNSWSVQNGDSVTVPGGAELFLRVSAGNTEEAKWLAPAPRLKEGAVFLVSVPGSDIAVKAPLPRDTARFEDAEFSGVPLGAAAGPVTVTLRMEAEKRGCFGAKMTFRIVPLRRLAKIT